MVSRLGAGLDHCSSFAIRYYMVVRGLLLKLTGVSMFVFAIAQLNHQQAAPLSVFRNDYTKICYTSGLPTIQAVKYS